MATPYHVEDIASWRQAAGVHEGVTFVTRPELARRLLERALTA